MIRVDSSELAAVTSFSRKELGKERCRKVNSLFELTITVVGVVMAAGGISSIVAGSLAIGIAIPFVISTFAGGKNYIDEEEEDVSRKSVSRKNKILFDTILSCVLLVLGSLCAANLVSPQLLGCSLFLPIILSKCFSCCRWIHSEVQFPWAREKFRRMSVRR